MLPTVSRRVPMQTARGQTRSSGSAGCCNSCSLCCFPCCCNCCSCLNLGLLKTKIGIMKLVEMVLGGICQSLLIKYGIGYSAVLGVAYSTFLTTACACLFSTGVLLLCYLLSAPSVSLVRQSFFETLFNGIAAVLYLGASSYLALKVQTELWPQYVITPYFQVYPALTAAYSLGIVVGCVHAYDTYTAYQWFRYRRA